MSPLLVANCNDAEFRSTFRTSHRNPRIATCAKSEPSLQESIDHRSPMRGIVRSDEHKPSALAGGRGRGSNAGKGVGGSTKDGGSTSGQRTSSVLTWALPQRLEGPSRRHHESGGHLHLEVVGALENVVEVNGPVQHVKVHESVPMIKVGLTQISYRPERSASVVGMHPCICASVRAVANFGCRLVAETLIESWCLRSGRCMLMPWLGLAGGSVWRSAWRLRRNRCLGTALRHRLLSTWAESRVVMLTLRGGLRGSSRLAATVMHASRRLPRS